MWAADTGVGKGDVIDTYISPLIYRIQVFDNGFIDEAKRLETEEADLRKELEELAMYLSDGQDVTICLDIAPEDADDIFQNRGSLCSYTS